MSVFDDGSGFAKNGVILMTFSGRDFLTCVGLIWAAALPRTSGLPGGMSLEGLFKAW
jgi:hypothetical protein